MSRPVIAAALILPPRRPPRAGAGKPPARLLGLTLLERSILEAVKAGAGKVTVLAGPADGDLAAVLAASAVLRRAGIRPEVLPAAGFAEHGALPAEGHVLVLERDVVFDAAFLALPSVSGLGPGESLLFVDTGGALGAGLAGAPGAFAGLAVCAPGGARALIAAWDRDPVSLPAGTLSGDGGVRAVDLGGRFCIPVTSRQAAREARRRLLASVRKPTDGFVSRTFNRPVSLALSRLFIRVGATPNMISAGGLALGLAGAWLVARGGYGGALLGAFLFQVASVVDGSDGEVAKLTHNSSPNGSWIDTVCDQIASLAFFAALPVGAYRSRGDAVYLALGATTLVASAALYALMIRHVRRFGAHGSMVQILDDFRSAARAPGALGRVAGLVSRLSFAVRRDFFAMAFLVLALVNGLGVAVWAIGLGVPGAVLFLAWFSARFAAERR